MYELNHSLSTSPLPFLITKYAKDISVSDIHFKTGQPVFIRKHGKIFPIDNDIMDINAIKDILLHRSSINLSYEEEKSIRDFFAGNSKATIINIDTTLASSTNCRINIYSDSNGLNLAIRILPNKIPAMKELRLPPVVQQFTTLKSGLVVVSGPTGSGKTTTLASILDNISENQAKHIITIEDPIEYHIPSKKSIITQREIYLHVNSFADGLKEALRQDPDIILVGEMRDAETISTAMQAAETGHLVFTTLHAGSTVEAIDRFSQYFDPIRHIEIRQQLANCLQGIVAQKLLKSKNDSISDRVAAFEVLLPTDAIKNTIRTGKSFRLKDYMNRNDGMITMEESIKGLKYKNLI